MNNITTEQIILAINSTNQETDIDRIHEAIEHRRRQLAQRKMWELKKGQEVWFNDTVRPTYLIGKKAIVEDINRTRVVVRMADTHEGGRFQGRITVTPTLLSITKP